MKRLFYLFLMPVFLNSGCANTIQEVITCYPPYADIYWGKTPSELERSGFSTPYSRTISGSSWEHWCYQVKKDGYHHSPIVCKTEGQSRNLDFYLAPLKTTITSEPSGATIYWGPSRDQLAEAKYFTPHTLNTKYISNGASWKDWYFQVKKKGYEDSEIVFLHQQSSDRQVHFELEPYVAERHVNEFLVYGSQATLTWEDHSADELGFKIERKAGSGDVYREIATVGENVTSFTDTGLRPGMTYYYRVRAYNSIGHSAYTEPIRVKTSIP
jgi:hypothetical protein